jgi:hypothetical protein
MQQYLIAKARNSVTGETQVSQDLTGARFQLHQRTLAQSRADQLAQGLTERTGDQWQGFLERYTPSQRR